MKTKQYKQNLLALLLIFATLLSISPIFSLQVSAQDTINGNRYVTATSGLNLRESKSLNSRILATIPYGTLIYVRYAVTANDGIRWAYTDYGAFGYVDSRYLSITPGQTHEKKLKKRDKNDIINPKG